MSVGLSALRALVTDGSRAALRDINPDYLLDEERPAYEYIHRFVRHHGRLPSVETLAENGITLARSRENLGYYVERLQARAVFTAIQESHPGLVNAMENRDMAAALAAIQQMYGDVRQRSVTNATSSVIQEAAVILDGLRQPRMHGDTIPFGFEPLDEATDGQQGGDVNVYASRPNMGKSFFLLKSMMAGWESMHSPMVVTMEMNVQQLTTRLMGMKSGINTRYIRRKELSTWGRNRLAESVEGFRLLPPMTFVSGHAIKSVDEIELLIGDIQPDCVYIDAAYLVKPDAYSHKRARWENITEVFNKFKAVADQADIPFLNTVQLSRNQKSRSSNLADGMESLAGADAIGQDATVVVGLTPGEGIDAETRRKHTVLKNREGPKNFSWLTKFEFNPVMDFSVVEARDAEVRATLRRNMI